MAGEGSSRRTGGLPIRSPLPVAGVAINGLVDGVKFGNPKESVVDHMKDGLKSLFGSE
jgi:hypothetical protein